MNERTKRRGLRMGINGKLLRLIELYKEIEKNNVYPPNFWDIIEYGKESYETRYSRVLCWLFDPKANHEAKSVFSSLIWNKESDDDAFKFSMDSEIDYEIYFVDEKQKQRYLDLLYVDEDNKKFIALELKVWTGAHSGQLKAYADEISKKYETYEGKFIYLTPFGEDSPLDEKEWDKRWEHMSYDELDEPLEKVLYEAKQNDDKFYFHTKKIIEDFQFDLKRKTMDIKFRKAAHELLQIITIAELEDDFAGEISECFLANKELIDSFFKKVKSCAMKQNKTPSQEGQELIRRLFNYFANGNISVDSPENFGNESKEERESNAIIPELNALGVVRSRITSGKGQGLWLHFSHDEKFPSIYMSTGNKKEKSLFPNDGIWYYYEDENKKTNPRIWSNSDARLVNEYLSDVEFEKLKTQLINKIVAVVEDFERNGMTKCRNLLN